MTAVGLLLELDPRRCRMADPEPLAGSQVGVAKT